MEEVNYIPTYSPDDYCDSYPDYQDWDYPYDWYCPYGYYWYPQPYQYCPYCGKKLEAHVCGES